MDNRATARARHDAFEAYGAEPIIYRGYPVRRGFALLLEDELTGNIDQLIEISDYAVTSEPPMPDSHARAEIMSDVIDHDRGQFSFAQPDWRPRRP